MGFHCNCNHPWEKRAALESTRWVQATWAWPPTSYIKCSLQHSLFSLCFCPIAVEQAVWPELLTCSWEALHKSWVSAALFVLLLRISSCPCTLRLVGIHYLFHGFTCGQMRCSSLLRLHDFPLFWRGDVYAISIWGGWDLATLSGPCPSLEGPLSLAGASIVPCDGNCCWEGTSTQSEVACLSGGFLVLGRWPV